VGFYLPKEFAIRVFPELADGHPNPRVSLDLTIASHDQAAQPVLTHWNQRTRDECHVTRLGGRASAFQDPSNTAAIALIAVRKTGPNTGEMGAWVARDHDDEEELESYLGPVLPATSLLRFASADGRTEIVAALSAGTGCDCSVERVPLPDAWTSAFPKFPSTDELAAEAKRRCGLGHASPDVRLIARHACEYVLFRAVESAIELPGLRAFPTIDMFTEHALRIINRRKARAGTSLELHVAAILKEEGVEFERGVQSERGHRPDFLFPSSRSYAIAEVGDASVAMLAVKTTLKDRWRQVLEEADKIPTKHLLTLDTGISTEQFDQLRGAGIRLVVPAPRARNYPGSVRAGLMTFGDFITAVRRPGLAMLDSG